MDEKKLTYINFAVFIILIIVLFSLIKPSGLMPKKVKIKTIAVKTIRPAPAPEEQQVYDIDKIRPREQKVISVEAKDLAEIYANYPEEDVGTSVIKGWANVSPKDKKEFMDGLNKRIEAQKEVLQRNPEDKKARQMLKISETLQKLALNNFNYNLKTD